ncbi:MAG: molybdopterin converting factor subunit 1 [Chitinophagaceae bacterium]|nr:MAG: molybdopterin converting factor subunit 1 [Chitinophagaceae bacterium]
MITILFFAQLREQLQCEKLQLEVLTSTTVKAVRERLVIEHPQWATFLMGEKVLFSVNQILVKESHPISDGDEVAFFPPVTGG